EVTQRAVNDVEPDIGTPLPGVVVVLNEGIEKHRRRETVVHPSRQQVRLESPLWQIDVVARVSERGIQPVTGTPRGSRAVRAFVAGIERAHARTAVGGQSPAAIGISSDEPLIELVAASRNDNTPRAIDGENVGEQLQ